MPRPLLLLAVPLLLALLLRGASAAPGAEVSGRWVLADSPAQFQQFKAEAIQRTLASMSLPVRALAGSRLEAVVTACGRYDIAVEGGVMRSTCDAKPTVTLNLDGTPSRYTSDQGRAYSVTAASTADRVAATFQADDGSMVTTYSFSAGALTVDKSIHSPYFGEPLRWSSRYRLQAQK